MFAQFQNMIKKQADKITKAIPSDLLNLGSSSKQSNNDFSRSPQKFSINGRQIIEKKLLAEGAFGFIWLAEDASTKQQYALKRIICMTEDKVRSAVLQKSLMEKLPQSPNIVKYYGGEVFRKDGNTVVIILMELCPGGNLFDILQKRQGKGIPQQTVRGIASSILQGLCVLHKAGFVHRDIKIQNVIIGKDKKMKICDFGSATTEIVDFSKIPKSQYEHTKQSIQAFTTPMYRPPQIVDPYLKYKVSGKADLWMLGCVLYTMSYFVHPFVQSNSVGISNAVYRFPNYPQQTKYKVSQKMQDFIRNLLTPNPQFRPSPQKMLQILSKWDDFTSIPLNQQAKRIKKQQQDKQMQMNKLNQKISKYDGDIPIQQLMRLQKKLQENSKQPYEKKEGVSYITKQTQKIAQNKPAYNSSIIQNTNKNTNTNNSDPFACFSQPQKSTVSQQVKKTPSVSTNQSNNSNVDFWSQAFTKPSTNTNLNNATKNNNTFDQFCKPSQAQSQSKREQSITTINNVQNFHQFFSQNASSGDQQPASSSKITKNQSKQSNLLDL